MSLANYHIYTDKEHLGEKDYAISFARFVATISIFLCHFYQYYCDGLTFWFNVSVQMFFFLSGLLYANRSIDDPIAFLKKGVKKILVPYYIYVIIACVIGRIWIPEDCTVEMVIKLFLLDAEGSYTALNNLWFISHILLCYLATPLFLKWLDYLEQKKSVILVLCVLLTLVGILVFFYKYAPYYKPWDTLCYFVGIVYGRMTKNWKSIWVTVMNLFFIIMAVATKAIYLISQNHMDEIYANDLADLQYQLYKVSHAFLGIAIVIVCVFIYKLIASLVSLRWFEPVLRMSDRYSYFIYLTHQIFMLGAFSLCALIPSQGKALFVIAICTLLAAVLLYWLSQIVFRLGEKETKNK